MKFIIALLVLNLNLILFSQESFKYFNLKTLKWGVLNTNGKTIVEPEYSNIYLKHGYYILRYENGHAGLVDTNGIRVLKRNYYSISVEAKDSIYVKDYGLCGILNSSMDWIFQSECESIYRKFDFYLLQGKTDVQVLNSRFEPLMPWFVVNIFKHPKSDKFVFMVQKNDRFGLVNEMGEILIPLDFDFLDLSSFDGNVKYLLGSKLVYTDLHKYPHGKNNIVFDFDGKIVFNMENEGLKVLSATKFALRNSNGDWGLFDIEKNKLIDYQYLELYPHGKHLYFVQNKNKKWGVVNERNDIIQPFEFIDPLSYGGGTAYVSNKSGIKVKNHTKKYALLSVSGKLLTDFIYDEIWSTDEGYFRVKLNGKSGLLDTNGVEILKPEFDGIQIYQSKGNELAVVRKEKTYFFINLLKKQVSSNTAYESVFIETYSPDLDFILVKKNGLYVFIDFNENLIIPYQFNKARPFEGKYASVQIGERYFIINKSGERIVEY